MKLKNLFSPLINAFSRKGLNSTNPKSRIQAILEELEPGSNELEDIAINDPDADVKICAINRLNSLDVMQQVLIKINDGKAKEITHQRFSKLLSGEIFPIPDLQDREAVIKGTLPNKTIEYVALNAKEPQLRILALHKVNRDALLGDIALSDANSQVKITAASQLGKKSTLERVCKQSRSKDKRVYKICKEKLTRIIDDEERPQRINQEILDLCDQLEKIYKRNLLIQEESTIIHLQEKWQEYKNFTNEQNQQCYQNIINKINISLEQLKQQQQDELLIVQNLQQIIHNLSIEAEALLEIKEQNNVGMIGSKLKAIELYKKSWNEQVQQINIKKQKDLIEQYQNILILIEQAEEQKENLSSFDLLKQYISQAEQLLAHSRYISEKIIRSLKNNFKLEEQNIDSSNPQYNDLQIRFKQRIGLLQQRISSQQEQYQILIQSSEKLIVEINNKLEQGKTEDAQQLKKQYHQLIESCNIISSRDKEEMLEKVRSSDSELNKLSSWKNWANNRERENLVQQAQDILAKIQQSDKNIAIVYEQYGDQVKSLRQQWKKLTGRSPDKLWEQFNNSCNLCFEQFTPYFDQQNKQREDNLLLKQGICTQLEDYINYMQWPSAGENETSEDIDWLQVNKILRQAKAEWKSIGPIENSQHQKLLKKYNHLVNIINAELKILWAKNQKKYQQLIEQVFALHKNLDKDLNKAINEAKSLQSQWNKIGPVQHFQRKTLWKNFRKGCDIIFNKRDEIKKESNQKDESILLEKTGLCENLEALIKQSDQQNLSLEDFKSAFADIQSIWSQSTAIAKNSTKLKEIEQRFKQAKQAYKKKIDQFLELQKLHQLELLQQKADICRAVENNQTESAEQDWNVLESLTDKSLEKAILKRFQEAQKMLEEPLSQQQLKILYKEKEQLCLSLEVISGKNSPDEDAQNRLKFQIEQMNNKTKQDTMQSIEEIILQWTLLADLEQHNSLTQRFKKAQ
ncbi:MAG: DUF349 domain-containing protein [Pseudomonadota bacterium]